jgi:hypothetical protein
MIFEFREGDEISSKPHSMVAGRKTKEKKKKKQKKRKNGNGDCT